MKKIIKTQLLFVVIFVQGCGMLATAPKTSVEKIPAVYDYSPPDIGDSKTNFISLILATPVFAKDFAYTNYAPFSAFSKSMENDYVEMLTKRGYRYVGPFNTYDEIVYADKKNADLLLESELAFQLSGEYPFYVNSGKNLLGLLYERYYANGELTLTGKINFFISEPFTHTKVWVKSIPIETQVLKIKSSKNDYSSLEDVRNDPEVWNAFVEPLKKVYQKSLQTAWNYLDPQELVVKKKEAEEIRKNSSFQKN